MSLSRRLPLIRKAAGQGKTRSTRRRRARCLWGKERFLSTVQDLSRAFALAVPHAEALRIRDDVAFFQAVRAALVKRAPGEMRTEEELDLAVRQIVSRAVAPEG